MKALVLVASATRRGAEVVGTELAAGLAGLGWSVTTAALAPSLAGDPLDVPVLGEEPLAPATLRRLRHLAHGHDVVLAGGSTTLPACAVALAGTGVPFVYRSIGDPRYWARNSSHRLRTAAQYRLARRVVALWPGAADDLHRLYGVSRARLRVVPNTADPARFVPATPTQRAAQRRAFGLGDHEPVVAFLGSLSPEKDPAAAITAMGHLATGTLLVAGDGPLRPDLEHLAARHAPGRVRFLGVLADPLPLLHAADAVLLTSRTEGMPGVAIEAALCGVPVVATDVGGTSAVVLHGLTGYLAAPGDAAGLASFLHRALAEGPALGARARTHAAREFSVHRHLRSWAQVLGEAAGTPRTEWAA